MILLEGVTRSFRNVSRHLRGTSKRHVELQERSTGVPSRAVRRRRCLLSHTDAERAVWHAADLILSRR